MHPLAFGHALIGIMYCKSIIEAEKLFEEHEAACMSCGVYPSILTMNHEQTQSRIARQSGKIPIRARPITVMAYVIPDLVPGNVCPAVSVDVEP